MSITRRLFLRNSAAAGAVAAAVVTPAVVDPASRAEAEFTAIPTAVVDKIKAWQDAHRASVLAANAYSASLRVKPIVKPECDRCFHAMVDANRDVGPAREAMIVALLRV